MKTTRQPLLQILRLKAEIRSVQEWIVAVKRLIDARRRDIFTDTLQRRGGSLKLSVSWSTRWVKAVCWAAEHFFFLCAPPKSRGECWSRRRTSSVSWWRRAPRTCRPAPSASWRCSSGTNSSCAKPTRTSGTCSGRSSTRWVTRWLGAEPLWWCQWRFFRLQELPLTLSSPSAYR